MVRQSLSAIITWMRWHSLSYYSYLVYLFVVHICLAMHWFHSASFFMNFAVMVLKVFKNRQDYVSITYACNVMLKNWEYNFKIWRFQLLCLQYNNVLAIIYSSVVIIRRYNWLPCVICVTRQFISIVVIVWLCNTQRGKILLSYC